MTSATRWSARSGSATCSPSRPYTASKDSGILHSHVRTDFRIATTVYTVCRASYFLVNCVYVDICCSKENGAVKPILVWVVARRACSKHAETQDKTRQLQAIVPTKVGT